MAYRSLAEVAEDLEPARPRLSFYRRWQLTVFLGAVQVFSMLVVWLCGAVTAGSLVAALVMTTAAVVIDYKLRPSRLADLERQLWLANLPHRRFIVDPAGFEKHFPR